MTNLNTVSDIAKRLGTSHSTVYNHLYKGTLDMTNEATIQEFTKKFVGGEYKKGRPIKFKKGGVFEIVNKKREGE